MHVNTVLQGVVPAARTYIVTIQFKFGWKKARAHDIVAQGFAQLAGHALQQFDVFPRERAANFVLRMNDANNDVFPVLEEQESKSSKCDGRNENMKNQFTGSSADTTVSISLACHAGSPHQHQN
jgi:hypothetical protein